MSLQVNMTSSINSIFDLREATISTLEGDKYFTDIENSKCPTFFALSSKDFVLISSVRHKANSFFVAAVKALSMFTGIFLDASATLVHRADSQIDRSNETLIDLALKLHFTDRNTFFASLRLLIVRICRLFFNSRHVRWTLRWLMSNPKLI